MSDENEQKIEAPKETEKKPGLKIQTVIITLADGRKGIFAGPELITATEMLLQVIPRIVHVDFLPGRDLPSKEVPGGDQKTTEQSEQASSVSDAGANVAETA